MQPQNGLSPCLPVAQGFAQRVIRVTALKRPSPCGLKQATPCDWRREPCGGPGPLLGTSQDVTCGAIFLLLAFSRCFSASPGVPETPRSSGRMPRAPRARQGLRDPWRACLLPEETAPPPSPSAPQGPVPAVLITETFLQSSRPAAFMVGGSVHWLSNFTVGLIFPFVQVSASRPASPVPPAQNPHAVKGEASGEGEPHLPFPQVGLGAYSFVIFGVICLLTTIYTFLVVPETKAKTFVEINQIFTKMNKVSEVHPEKEELEEFPPSTRGQ